MWSMHAISEKMAAFYIIQSKNNTILKNKIFKNECKSSLKLISVMIIVTTMNKNAFQ